MKIHRMLLGTIWLKFRRPGNVVTGNVFVPVGVVEAGPEGGLHLLPLVSHVHDVLHHPDHITHTHLILLKGSIFSRLPDPDLVLGQSFFLQILQILQNTSECPEVKKGTLPVPQVP